MKISTAYPSSFCWPIVSGLLRRNHRFPSQLPRLRSPAAHLRASTSSSVSSFRETRLSPRRLAGKVSMGKGLLDLEKHFAQYGAYHNNPVNIVIHTVFVWPILFTALLLFYYTPPVLPIPPPAAAALPFGLGGVLRLNFGFFFALVYALFYVSFDVVAGSLGAVLVTACWVGSSVLGSGLEFSLACKVVGIAQLVCWGGQFIGHGAFEKRAPALLDNLVQAFLMAPFFVLLEVLRKLLGYEPYPGFDAHVHAKIETQIKEWKERKQKKIS